MYEEIWRKLLRAEKRLKVAEKLCCINGEEDLL
jgi:hypothetical protein